MHQPVTSVTVLGGLAALLLTALPASAAEAEHRFPPGLYVLGGGLRPATAKDAAEVREPFALHPVQYVLSGGPKPTDRLAVDDDLEVRHGDVQLFVDEDRVWSKDDVPRTEGCYCGWPILLALPPGSNLRIRVTDHYRSHAELGPLYLHRYDGASKCLMRGKRVSSNARLPHVFFDQEFNVDEGFPPPRERRPERALTADRLGGLWEDLGSTDATRAYFARWALAASPRQAVPYLKERLRPVAPLVAGKQERVGRLLAELDDDSFAVRERASAELERLGEAAVPALRQGLEDRPSLEVRRRIERLLKRHEGTAAAPAPSRELAAVTALEHAGTAEARELLEALAKGVPAAHLTREAKDALERLGERPGRR